MLQCVQYVAVCDIRQACLAHFLCCSVLQYVAGSYGVLRRGAVYCSVLRCVAVRCSMLQCMMQYVALCDIRQACRAHFLCCKSELQCCAVSCSFVAVCCSVLQYVAVCCSVLLHVAEWCMVLQCALQYIGYLAGLFAHFLCNPGLQRFATCSNVL